jgi:hypothetical protein
MSNLLIFYLAATAPLGLALSWFAIREEINRGWFA